MLASAPGHPLLERVVRLMEERSPLNATYIFPVLSTGELPSCPVPPGMLKAAQPAAAGACAVHSGAEPRLAAGPFLVRDALRAALDLAPCKEWRCPTARGPENKTLELSPGVHEWEATRIRVRNHCSVACCCLHAAAGATASSCATGCTACWPAVQHLLMRPAAAAPPSDLPAWAVDDTLLGFRPQVPRVNGSQSGGGCACERQQRACR